MAGLVVADGIQTPSISDGTTTSSASDVVNGSARAWVNFNGTGTVAIRASYNVSSITDNGVGDYTVNFTTAMSDVNYSTNMSSSQNSSAQYCTTNMVSQLTTSVRVANSNFSGSLVDNANMLVTIHR